MRADILATSISTSNSCLSELVSLTFFEDMGKKQFFFFKFKNKSLCNGHENACANESLLTIASRYHTRQGQSYYSSDTTDKMHVPLLPESLSFAMNSATPSAGARHTACKHTVTESRIATAHNHTTTQPHNDTTTQRHNTHCEVRGERPLELCGGLLGDDDGLRAVVGSSVLRHNLCKAVMVMMVMMVMMMVMMVTMVTIGGC